MNVPSFWSKSRCECEKTLNSSLIHLWDESKGICFFVAAIAIVFAVSTAITHPCWQIWGWCLWLLVLVCFYSIWLQFLPCMREGLVCCGQYGALTPFVSVAHGQHKHMKHWLNIWNRYAAFSFIISCHFFHVKNCVVTCEPHPTFWKLLCLNIFL